MFARQFGPTHGSAPTVGKKYFETNTWDMTLWVFVSGALMPYVNIKVTKEGVSPQQKAELIRGVTQLLADVLGKNPATTVVVIDEVDTDNWGIGGETVSVRRQKGQ